MVGSGTYLGNKTTQKRSSLLVSELEAVVGAMQPASGPAWVSSPWDLSPRLAPGPPRDPAPAQGACLGDRQACPHLLRLAPGSS